MKNLFAKRKVSNRRINNLEIPNQNTVKYGDKSSYADSWTTYLEWPSLRNRKEHSYDKFQDNYTYIVMINIPAVCVPSLKYVNRN